MANDIDFDTVVEIRSNLKRMVGWALATATIISSIPVAINFFNILDISLVSQFIFGIAILLLASTVYLSLIIRDLRNKMDHISTEAENKIKEIKQKTADIYYGLAFANFYEEPPEEFDDSHYITEVNSKIKKANEGWIFMEEFKGYNVSNQETKYLSIRIDSESPLDMEDTSFTMFHKKDGDWVTSDKWRWENIGKYSIRFHMYFSEALAPDESFQIKYETETGEWPTKGQEFIEIPQHRFTRGTEQMCATFEFKNEPDEITVKKAKHDMAGSYFRDAERVSFEMEDFETKMLEKDSSYLSQIKDEQANALYIVGIKF